MNVVALGPKDPKLRKLKCCGVVGKRCSLRRNRQLDVKRTWGEGKLQYEVGC